jgi:hypothetical protein
MAVWHEFETLSEPKDPLVARVLSQAPQYCYVFRGAACVSCLIKKLMMVKQSVSEILADLNDQRRLSAQQYFALCGRQG